MATQKNVNKNAPAPAATSSDKAADVKETSTKGGVSLKVKDLRDDVMAKVDGKISAKLTIIQTAKQRLAEAKDTFADALALESAARSIAGDVAFALYQARLSDSIADAELSAICGDIFGYKPKRDGTPSATPEGKGEDIRKRVRFMVSTTDAIYGRGDGPKPVQEATPEAIKEIEAIVETMERGEMPLYTAFDKVREALKKERTTVAKAVDPKFLDKLCDELCEDATAEIIRNSEVLIAVYARLGRIVDAIMTVPAE